MTTPVVPLYGKATLSELTPSILSALGLPAERNALGLDPAPRACVLLVDGLGADLLRVHPQAAPFLAALGERVLTAGFPATTATSLGSIGTGLPPALHGMLGYQVAIPGEGRLLNCLRWSRDVDPVSWQPNPTVFERAADAGVEVCYVAPGQYEHSGLTRAVYRGARYAPAKDVDARVAEAAYALARGERSLVHVYFGDLDLVGHLTGWGTPEWLEQLAIVDDLAQRLADAVPDGTALYITADHGMVNVGDKVDADATPALREGVELLGGEARARHVYAKSGAAPAVLETWREHLAGRAWVMSREQALDEGWFGPAAADGMRARIGDVVAAPYGDCAIVASQAEPLESSLTGMHGSLTAAEQRVPLLEVRRP